MTDYNQNPEPSQNFIKTLSEEITEIKDNGRASKQTIETIKNNSLENGKFLKTCNDKLDKLDRSVSQYQKNQKRQIEITPEVVNLVKWPVILIIAILLIIKAYSFFKGDARSYKDAWQQMYNVAGSKKQHEMDSILFYGHGVGLDSIAK